jgi:hypothetical protein
LPHALRLALSDLAPLTVRYMGWAGLKNGELLTAAEAQAFNVLVTGDKTVQFEQNMQSRSIGVVSLTTPHWPMVKDHIGEIALAIMSSKPSSFTWVDCGKFNRRRPKPQAPEPG